MKLKEIFTPDVWRMLLTFIFIVGYLIFNSFLSPHNCDSIPECVNNTYYYNSPNFFGNHCKECITYNGFVIDLGIFLIMQFIFPYIAACLILAFYGYRVFKYGGALKSNVKK